MRCAFDRSSSYLLGSYSTPCCESVNGAFVAYLVLLCTYVYLKVWRDFYINFFLEGSMEDLPPIQMT